jgi:uncharacterized membrane protein
MPTLIRILRLLAIVVWVGGIVFFAFVLAPVAFRLLPSQHLAGAVVGGTLRVLDIIGLVCGFIFWAATALLFRASSAAHKGRYEAQILFATIMLAATAYLHANILPAMEVDRASAGGDIEAAPATDPAKIHFEKLHTRSERVEGAILFCGLAIVILMARESLPSTS